MVTVPRIVLFRAQEAQQDEILAALKRRDFIMRIVSSAQEVRQILDDEQEGFDAFLIPAKLASGQNGSSVCIELRANPELGDTPIVALCAAQDRGLQNSLYELGADVVLSSPWDADLICSQINALGRRVQTLTARSDLLQQHQLAAATFNAAFDVIQEGIVVVNTAHQLIACNHAARLMFGLTKDAQAEQWKRILPNLSAQLRNHEQETKKQLGLLKPQRQSTLFSAAINRGDGQLFSGEIEIYSVYDHSQRIIALVLRVVELAQIKQLAGYLFQGNRARALALMTSAACIELVAPQAGAERSPLSATSKALEALPKSNSSINQVLTALLEFLDLVMSPAIAVRVNVERDLKLAVRSQDLIQLLGQMILHASQFVGSEGEILVESSDHVPGQGVTVLLSAQSKRALPFVSDPRLAALIDLELARFLGVKEHELGLAAGLLAAQKTAQLYRSSIEYQHPSETSLKIRVRLPAA